MTFSAKLRVVIAATFLAAVKLPQKHYRKTPLAAMVGIDSGCSGAISPCGRTRPPKRNLFPVSFAFPIQIELDGWTTLASARSKDSAINTPRRALSMDSGRPTSSQVAGVRIH